MNVVQLNELVGRTLKFRKDEIFRQMLAILAAGHVRRANASGGRTDCDCHYCFYLRKYVHNKIRMLRRKNFTGLLMHELGLGYDKMADFYLLEARYAREKMKQICFDEPVFEHS